MGMVVVLLPTGRYGHPRTPHTLTYPPPTHPPTHPHTPHTHTHTHAHTHTHSHTHTHTALHTHTRAHTLHPPTHTGVTLLLSLLAFTQLYQPVGFVVAVAIAVPGFFLPLSLHRIPHPSGWPNPLMVGGLVAGVGLTALTYLFRIFLDILTCLSICTHASCTVVS